MARYYVVEKRLKLTQETLSLQSPGGGVKCLLVFKIGGCRCEKQNYTCHGALTDNSREYSGYPKKLVSVFTCRHCGYIYDANPATILFEDYLYNVNKRLEVIQVRTIDLDALDRVWRLVQKKCGKESYSASEEIFGLDKLRYYYPGKEYREAPLEPKQVETAPL